MIEVKKDSLFMKNPNTGLYDNVSMVTGESAYQTAKRNGYYGSETKWLDDIGCVGGKPELAGESEYSSSINTSGTGNKLNPVYVDADGVVTPIKYTFGDSCELTSTDDPDDPERKLITSIALQKAIDSIMNNEYNPNAKAVVPSPSGVFVYNGLKQEPTWVNYDPDVVSISGILSAINAGSYTATVTPKEPFSWKDGTSDPVEVVWSIEKADNHIDIPRDIIKVSEDEVSKSITVKKSGNGEVIAVSSDTEVITAVVSGNTVTISGDGKTAGNATVTIYVKEDTNYKESNKIVLNVVTDYINIVSWGSGSTNDVTRMIEGHYKGIIDISEYWSIGDSRTINLNEIPTGTTGEQQPAQNLKLIIIGMDHDNLANQINGKSKAAITVQVENGLINPGYMSTSNTDISASLWTTCPRRSWCNNDFYNALPEGIKSLIKPVNKITNRGCSNTVSNYETYRVQESTVDNVFLLSDYELFAESDTYTVKSEWLYGELGSDGIQYEYMKTLGNRIKSVNGTTSYWFTRSANFTESNLVYFTGVNLNGESCSTLSTADFGILPAFCL